jgi:uncharacterized membrane-anchored protein
MSRPIRWFFVVVAVQAGFLLTWAGYHEWVRSAAEVILVKGRPVDPRDLLRGDYMILGYEIGLLPDSMTQQGDGKPRFRIGEDIWVLLEKHGAYHEVVAASRERPPVGANQTLIRGRVTYPRGAGRTGGTGVEYGIEEFFVPEGKGTPRFQKLEVELSVSGAHRLYLRRVLLDGKAYP